ncbi:hypothetical protein [Ferrimicrobium acidiphilum]|nr:hypothetical protein [Ferrimicrobium acidiphilum]
MDPWLTIGDEATAPEALTVSDWFCAALAMDARLLLKVVSIGMWSLPAAETLPLSPAVFDDTTTGRVVSIGMWRLPAAETLPLSPAVFDDTTTGRVVSIGL